MTHVDLVTTELIVEKADTECEASAVITSIATDFIVDFLIDLDLEKVNNLLVRVLNCFFFSNQQPGSLKSKRM